MALKNNDKLNETQTITTHRASGQNAATTMSLCRSSDQNVAKRQVVWLCLSVQHVAKQYAVLCV